MKFTKKSNYKNVQQNIVLINEVDKWNKNKLSLSLMIRIIIKKMKNTIETNIFGKENCEKMLYYLFIN